jgi:ParB-like chromosome segregation protein Spo0J
VFEQNWSNRVMTTATLPADKFDKSLTFVRPATPPQRVPLDNLKVLPGFNTRVKDEEYAERVAAIRQSISRHGFYEDKPFSVTMLPDDETVYIFDGEHRFDAARLARDEDGVEFPGGVPVAFAAEGATVKDLTVHLVHGNAGANLNPVEMAAVVRRLVDLGLNKDEIADSISRTPRHVENLMVLAGANTTVKKAVAEGKIAAAEAVKLVRKHGSKDAAEKITAAVKAAEEKGKAKATPKTMASGPKMKRVEFTTSLATGDAMGDVLKAMATQIRQTVQTDDADKLVEDGRIVVAMFVIDHEAEAAAAQRAEEKAKADAAKAEAAAAKAEAKKVADAEKAAAKKAADKAKADAKKAAAKKTLDAAKTLPPKAEGKTPEKATTRKSAQKPAEAPAGDSATTPAPDAGSASSGAPAGTDDANNGL